MKLRLIALASFATASAFADVRINAVCPRPEERDDLGREYGWVELVNKGDSAAELG